MGRLVAEILTGCEGFCDLFWYLMNAYSNSYCSCNEGIPKKIWAGNPDKKN